MPLNSNNAIPLFHDTYKEYLREQLVGYRLKDTEMPDNLVLITLSRFEGKYYSLRQHGITILALGDWDRGLAPPSLVEFILTLVVREALGFVCPTLRGSMHLGTRGCVCDFSAQLQEARFKALGGFICHDWQTKLEAKGLDSLVQNLLPILNKSWPGTPDSPQMPAGIAAKLGYNLFLTKGHRPTFGENVREFFTQEFFKVFLNVILAIFH